MGTFMRLLLLFTFVTFPFQTFAATSATILSNGDVLSSFGNDKLHEYDVVYKGNIYRCMTYHDGQASSELMCFKLKDRPIQDLTTQ